MIILVTLLPLVTVSPVTAVKPSSITWSRTYGQLRGFDSIDQTRDGGFVVAGAYSGVWVLKTDALGEPLWEKEYAPRGYISYLSEVGSVQETRDRGYLVAGSALSLGHSTGVDGWLLKLDQAGNVQWSKTYGGQADDGFYMAEQTNDGGYVVAGNTASVSSHSFNGWILRLDQSGNVIWQKAFVGEDIHSVDKTRDGGFVVAGTVGVDNKAEAWVFKLDREGNVVWQKAYEVAIRTEAFSIHETQNEGYIVAGHSSFGVLILRLDRESNILWQRSLSLSGITAFSVLETVHGGFVVTGRFTPTSSGTGLRGPFLMEVDAKGNLAWERVYGGLNDFLYQTKETKDGGLIVAGWVGLAWVLKLDHMGSMEGCALGSSSNATLTQSPITVSSPSIIAINANITVARADVTVTFGQGDVEIQCFAVMVKTNGRDARQRRNNHPVTMV